VEGNGDEEGVFGKIAEACFFFDGLVEELGEIASEEKFSSIFEVVNEVKGGGEAFE